MTGPRTTPTGSLLPPLPDDRKCPECGHHLCYDDGAYYCDCTHGETHNCVCKLALKRWPSV